MVDLLQRKQLLGKCKELFAEGIYKHFLFLTKQMLKGAHNMLQTCNSCDYLNDITAALTIFREIILKSPYSVLL